MKIIKGLQQGSAEWLQFRATRFGSSEAAAMLGLSKFTTRSELLRIKHTGLDREFSDWFQRNVLDKGHAVEAATRPLIEAQIDDVLYPATVQGPGRLVGSCDGILLDTSMVWECKQWNEALAAEVAAGRVPDTHMPQCQHLLLVTGAQRLLFTVSDGTGDRMVSAEVLPSTEWFERLHNGWIQFERDLAAYVPPATAEPVRAEAMESLPAVSVRLDGALSVAGNLPTFAEALKAFIARMPAKPATDTDFATCEAACKSLKKAEEALDAAEAGALASITDVEAMRRAVADCRKLARDTRLAAEKLVERRKVEIKEQAVAAAKAALDKHIGDLNGELAPMRLQPVTADFAGAIKGLRSIASMQDALDTTLANGKIAADAQARGIRANLADFKAAATGFEFLFNDLGQLVHKAADDFSVLVRSRVDAHRAAEAEKERQRAAAEAQRIAAAEQRAREDEAARIAAEQRQQAEETASLVAGIRAESRRVEWPKNPAYIRKTMGTFECMATDWENDPREVVREAIAEGRRYLSGLLADAEQEAAAAEAQRALAAAAAPAPISPVAASVAAPAAATPATADSPVSRTVSPAPAVIRQPVDEPASLNLGAIKARLGFALSADFIADTLHIEAATMERGLPRFRESDFSRICAALIEHVENVQMLQAA